MKIGGLTKTSLIEYPGMISAVVFTQGCNFRCPYCHNPELVEPSLSNPKIPEDEVIDFLKDDIIGNDVGIKGILLKPGILIPSQIRLISAS